jgi:hypothetical protein
MATTTEGKSTTVVRIRRRDGKIVAPCDIYIGRAMTQGGWNLKTSKWANPFTLAQYKGDRAACLAAYRTHVEARPDLMMALEELRGHVLGCWCVEPKCHTCRAAYGTCSHLQCHGEVLIQLMEEQAKKKQTK